MTEDAVDQVAEVDEARRQLFEGGLRVLIHSPFGTDVSFRFTPMIDRKTGQWNGRQWWLWRGRDYVGIVTRSGRGFQFQTTSRSTHEPLIHKARGLLLMFLGTKTTDLMEEGYRVTVRESGS